MATGEDWIERVVTSTRAEEWTIGTRVIGAVADVENIQLDLKSQIRMAASRVSALIVGGTRASGGPEGTPQGVCPTQPAARAVT